MQISYQIQIKRAIMYLVKPKNSKKKGKKEIIKRTTML